MKKLIMAIMALIVFVSVAMALSPLNRVKDVTEKIINILSQETTPSSQKRELIKEEINKIFDWEEFSKRSLSQHWNKLNPQQKSDFIEYYKKLLESVYAEKLDQYSGEKVRYEGEEISGNSAIVKVIVIGYKGSDVPLIYRLLMKNGNWYVYDVVVEGVSLVNNYRSQFNAIMLKSGYEGLIKAMKEKIEGKGETIK